MSAILRGLTNAPVDHSRSCVDLWCCRVGVLALDLSLPLGVAGGVPYALVVLVASLARRQGIVVPAALVASALTFIGYGFSEPGGDPSAVLLNRVMALGLLWIMAAILIARERSEDKQEEREHRFQRIVGAAPDGIVMVDAGGKITLVNQQTVAQFGYTREELIGQSIEVLVPPESRTNHQGLQGAYMAEPSHRMMGDFSDLLWVPKGRY